MFDWKCVTMHGAAPSDFPIGKDLAATQESLHTTQNSLSDCFNEVRLQTLGHSCGHKVGKVWEREGMPTDFWV